MRLRAIVALGIAAAATSIAVAGASAGAVDSACVLPRGSERVSLDPSSFSTRITNRWWPMSPGTRWVYRETNPDGTVQRDVVRVLARTKLVANGIRARAVSDVATEGGSLVEVTEDWYAQDRCGNVWYLGEATTEYENGKPKTTEGSFEAGVDGAQPGVIVPAKPRPGLRFRQEYYRGHAEDVGEIFSLREQVQVPYGHFGAGKVLMSRDLNPLEPKVLEYKFYVRGIGPVLAIGVSGDTDREELVRYTKGR
jgi:hypothetical protein